jgi:predicted Zn-dependent protease
VGALEPALREACRSAAPGPRDLQALERATGPSAWLDMEWGDYRAHVGDLAEAERCHVRAAEREPWSAQPWLRLAGLRERRGDRAGAAQALRAVLERVPRHQGAMERLDELAPPRRRRRASST